MEATRNGNFTSSQIYRLCGAPKPAQTYIQKKNFERKLKRSITGETNAKAANWGKLLEMRAFELLGFEYQMKSKETLRHPEINYWLGSPDIITTDKVGDIKCPWTLDSFCQLVENCTKGIETFKDEHPDYYFQLLSNAIITGKSKIELVVYVPYQDELQDIREMTSNFDGNQNPYSFIYFAEDNDLPYLNKEGEYKNLNIFTWDVPANEKEFLTTKVKQYGNQLK
jgi:hypothetical protein